MDDKTDYGDDLTKMYKDILKLSCQVPISHRRDVHSVEFLRRAMNGQEWTRNPLFRIATNELTF